METIRFRDNVAQEWNLLPKTAKISEIYERAKIIYIIVDDCEVLLKGHWRNLSSLKKYKDLTIKEF